MEVETAVQQIDSIWKHVARAETFRGYRPTTVACTGMLGLVAAFVQHWLVPNPLLDIDTYLLIWVAVATASVVLVGAELGLSWLRTKSALKRQALRRAVQQFVPCLFVGGVLTWVVSEYHLPAARLLPGLWGVCFSLGVFASLPYVTPNVSWVALYYLAAGGICLAASHTAHAFHPVFMGGTFGIGQILMAWVLMQAEEGQHGQV